ncbi:hypothetical protein [Persicitalea jodogahamensis]|uniref:Uncharacterized protein n=1 Tax=Persicitalea jodogahamensis TaxID=402147 RepID=A0A8J3GB83_9BACT|nr:hypothetical protein [Persicitalea jodogahamensis]GHB79956.1 hypothetical protein GCM10007390_37680 [Persicitalea jodogahamensis]
MNHYSHFCAEDFVWDEAFRQWILAPTRENYRMWSNWLEENPEMTESVQLARDIVLSLHCRGPTLTDFEVEIEVQKTIDRLS